jgi:pyruvate kinase
VRRTKIVATLGPSTWEEPVLAELLAAGVDVVRLNFSHGEREFHRELIVRVRDVAARVGRPVAVLQDLAGPKVRIGAFADEPVQLRHDQIFTLTARDVPGNESEVGLVYKNLPRDVTPGDALLLADGALELSVERIDGPDIICRVIVGGELSSHKGINLPSGTIGAPILDDEDEADLALGLASGVDYVALSFVRTSADVHAAAAAMARHGGDAPLVAKIEQRLGIDNYAAILAEVDAVMVARGDLGVEIPFEEVPSIQKQLIAAANREARPVITATQMLRSMVDNPRPTRAEVSDVANAILDGSDAVMLSEETAVGDHPVAAVRAMDRIARAAEAMFPYREWRARYDTHAALDIDEAAARAACQTADAVDAAAILTLTKSGSTTRLVAKYRPRQPILALTGEEKTWRALALVWGAVPLRVAPVDDAEELERQALTAAFAEGHLKAGDRAVLTAGLPLHRPGCTNLVRIVTVGDGGVADVVDRS